MVDLAHLKTEISDAVSSAKTAISEGTKNLVNNFANNVAETLAPSLVHRGETLQAQERAATGEDVRPLPTPGGGGSTERTR